MIYRNAVLLQRNIYNYTQSSEAEFILERKRFFIVLSHAHFHFLRSISLNELKKIKLQERFTLMTHDSIGHLKMLCRNVYR